MMTLAYDDSGWTQRLARAKQEIPTALADETLDLAQALKESAQDGLSGAILQERSGTLAASLALDVEPEGGAVEAGLSSDLPYAAYQEYGVSGLERVGAYWRRVSVVYGRPPVRPVAAFVAASTRAVDYAGTGFLSRPLEGLSDAIAQGLADAVMTKVTS